MKVFHSVIKEKMLATEYINYQEKNWYKTVIEKEKKSAYKTDI